MCASLEELAIQRKGWWIAAGWVRTVGVTGGTEVLYQQVVLICG